MFLRAMRVSVVGIFKSFVANVAGGFSLRDVLITDMPLGMVLVFEALTTIHTNVPLSIPRDPGIYI